MSNSRKFRDSYEILWWRLFTDIFDYLREDQQTNVVRFFRKYCARQNRLVIAYSIALQVSAWLALLAIIYLQHNRDFIHWKLIFATIGFGWNLLNIGLSICLIAYTVKIIKRRIHELRTELSTGQMASCVVCDYELRNLKVSNCPECGCPTRPTYGVVPEPT